MRARADQRRVRLERGRASRRRARAARVRGNRRVALLARRVRRRLRHPRVRIKRLIKRNRRGARASATSASVTATSATRDAGVRRARQNARASRRAPRGQPGGFRRRTRSGASRPKSSPTRADRRVRSDGPPSRRRNASPRRFLSPRASSPASPDDGVPRPGVRGGVQQDARRVPEVWSRRRRDPEQAQQREERGAAHRRLGGRGERRAVRRVSPNARAAGPSEKLHAAPRTDEPSMDGAAPRTWTRVAAYGLAPSPPSPRGPRPPLAVLVRPGRSAHTTPISNPARARARPIP